MKQRTLAMMTGFEQYTRKTRRAIFLEEMEQVVPWRELCALGAPHYPHPGKGRRPGVTDPGTGEPAPAGAGGANHDGHDRGRDHPARTHFDQEPGAAARSGDAPDEEGQTMVLRDEGARGSR